MEEIKISPILYGEKRAVSSCTMLRMTGLILKKIPEKNKAKVKVELDRRVGKSFLDYAKKICKKYQLNYEQIRY